MTMPNHCRSLFVPFALIAVLGLASCTTEQAETAITDHDQDGVQQNAGDCDDFNNTIRPGATDTAGDGIDQDCSGADTPAAALTDIDGDGVSVDDGDCDDKNSTVYPNARERSGDGIDSNCDGDEKPALGENKIMEIMGLVDTDMDGAISFEEFAAACAEHAMVLGKAEPGVVNTHSSCSGTNTCRGMHLHPWGEFFEHDCHGVNYCAGWSCTETAVDQKRDAPTVFKAAGCNNCHHDPAADFVVLVPPGEDAAAAPAKLLAKSDNHLRSAIAFGLSGVDPNGNAYQNMPHHYDVMSRAEMNTVIAWIRTGKLVGANFDYGSDQGPAKP
jgi:Putative metal-binding motif